MDHSSVDEDERQLEYETDMNTTYNTQSLGGSIRTGDGTDYGHQSRASTSDDSHLNWRDPAIWDAGLDVDDAANDVIAEGSNQRPEPERRTDAQRRQRDTISSSMPIKEVINCLVHHGCPDITKNLNLRLCDERPISRGGFGDIHRGTLRGGTKVALKSLRLYVDIGEENRKALKCAQIATGLAYLHEINVVHGDLKGANVLLSNDGVAQITDFGNAVLGSSTLAFTESTTRSHLSTRWAAPEQLDDKVAHSRQADVYSLGMTILEVISRRKPYANIGTENAVITAILIKRQHPERPEDTIPTESKRGNTLWSLLEVCWSWNPEDRPEAIEVARTLKRIKQKDLFSRTHSSHEPENAHFPMKLEDPCMPPSLQRPRAVSLPLTTPHASRSGTPSRNLPDAETMQEEKHRIAFMRAERDAEASLARGDGDARYIFNGFPIWLNWDLYTRLENLERHMRGRELLPRATRPYMQQAIHDEWYSTRNKWADRLRDPKWARFMNETGRILETRILERQTSVDHALNSARAYSREKAELPFSVRQDRGEYRWDSDYRHREWHWVEKRTWRWIVERENDERREKGRVPLPRYVDGMSRGNWRDVRDVWHTTANKWIERLNDPEWVARDELEGASPERRLKIRKRELARRQHGVMPRSIDYKSLDDGDVWHIDWPYWDSVSPSR